MVLTSLPADDVSHRVYMGWIYVDISYITMYTDTTVYAAGVFHTELVFSQGVQ